MDAPGSMESTTRSTMIEINVQHSEHIDSERKKENLYWDCYQGIFKDENPAEMTFEQVEEKIL